MFGLLQKINTKLHAKTAYVKQAPQQHVRLNADVVNQTINKLITNAEQDYLFIKSDRCEYYKETCAGSSTFGDFDIVPCSRVISCTTTDNTELRGCFYFMSSLEAVMKDINSHQGPSIESFNGILVFPLVLNCLCLPQTISRMRNLCHKVGLSRETMPYLRVAHIILMIVTVTGRRLDSVTFHDSGSPYKYLAYTLPAVDDFKRKFPMLCQRRFSVKTKCYNIQGKDQCGWYVLLWIRYIVMGGLNAINFQYRIPSMKSTEDFIRFIHSQSEQKVKSQKSTQTNDEFAFVSVNASGKPYIASEKKSLASVDSKQNTKSTREVKNSRKCQEEKMTSNRLDRSSGVNSYFNVFRHRRQSHLAVSDNLSRSHVGVSPLPASNVSRYNLGLMSDKFDSFQISQTQSLSK